MPKTKITLAQVEKHFKKLSDAEIARHSQGFFKTGKGEYGEGDKFLGIRVPVIKKQIKEFEEISLNDNLRLLKSKFHEIRLFALLLLVKKFASSELAGKKAVYENYIKHTRYINNWDLVDSSAHQIAGGYLLDKSRCPLYKFAGSKNLWERRIAIIATQVMQHMF